MVSTCGKGFIPLLLCCGEMERKKGGNGQLSCQLQPPRPNVPVTQQVSVMWRNWSDLFHQPWDKGVQHFPYADNYDLSKVAVKPWGKIQPLLNAKHPEFHPQRIAFSNTIYWGWRGTSNSLLRGTRDDSAILESSVIEHTSVRVTHQI